MSTRGRAGLIARIREVRSASGPGPSSSEPGPTVDSSDRLRALGARISHLEELIEGLQDSVYRENQRTNQRLIDLEARIEPSAIAASLSKDARERGL